MSATTLVGTPDPNEPTDPTTGGTVLPFTPRPTDAVPGTALEPAGELVDGELVPADENAAIDARLRAQIARRATGIVRVIGTHERTTQLKAVAAYRVRKAPQDAARLTWFAIRGHGRWIAKGWTWATHGDLRADARAARISGDSEARRAAQLAIREDARHRWAKLAVALRRITVVACVLLVLAIALVIVHHVVEWSDMPGWLRAIYTTLDVLAGIMRVLLWIAPVGWLVAAVSEGRDRTPGVGWLTKPDRESSDSWVDERMISQALAHLGIGPLDKFFKSGGTLTYSVGARVDGDGTYAQIRLPMGVTADMVAAQRPKLAANLGRASLETWPTKGEEDGILDLWVADKGKLAGGAGDWPYLHDGEVDVFAGVAIGLSQRGVQINAPLVEANWLIGGRPGQGKSAAMRTLLLGAALDPTAELWVFVMGQSPDFDPFVPRLARYQMGMDDSVAEGALQALEDLLAEMERRGKVLGAQPGKPPKVSRKLADKPGLGLHPLVCAIDECHELFMHPKFGKQAAELAIRLIKRGRKYGIILVLATQSPTTDSIPKEVTRNVSCGVAFAVADHVANDGLLGSGKYRAGIRATDLRTKTDRGTSVAVGVTDATFELVRWYYVPFEDGRDMVSPVIARAVAAVADAGSRVTATESDVDDTPPVDHLVDIREVLGADKRVRTQQVITRLAALNPAEYDGWTFPDLKAALIEHGIGPVKSDGVMVVRTDDVTNAIAERDENRDTEDDEESGS
jgi:S-DNA-T family DNA segregation ATPase FtsK/SpoIIIE